MGMVYRNIDAFVFQSNYTAKTINRVIIENRLEHTCIVAFKHWAYKKTDS